jgi:phosphoribosylamine--glycine ligase
VVLAAGGYPGKYETGKVIGGLAEAEQVEDVKVLHAGTKRDGADLVTAGGRVLGVTASGANLTGALDKAYQAVQRIQFEGMQYRRDIGNPAAQSFAAGDGRHG